MFSHVRERVVLSDHVGPHDDRCEAGLFGTVWGIMKSFNDIGRMGSANLATVAPGISEALIATAIGLVAAIPAVMAFNFFQRKIRVQKSEIMRTTVAALPGYARGLAFHGPFAFVGLSKIREKDQFLIPFIDAITTACSCARAAVRLRAGGAGTSP